MLFCELSGEDKVRKIEIIENDVSIFRNVSFRVEHFKRENGSLIVRRNEYYVFCNKRSNFTDSAVQSMIITSIRSSHLASH